ncbi:MAG: hypothetical protein Q8M29_08040 [Bacteroidota bacterium]|nr:hypothetical protein [Bacteroidota bacterium]
MFKKNKKYIIVLVIVFTAIVYVQMNAPKPVKWNKTYKSKDKIPFGCKVMYDLLDKSAFNGRLEIEKENVFKTLEKVTAQKNQSSSIFINDNLAFDKVETKLLLNYVGKGNKVLLAASNINGLLADTLKLKTNMEFSYFIPAKADSVFSVVYHQGEKDQKVFTYREGVTPVYFTSFDTLKTSVIAADLKKNPIYISVKWGKGEFYVLSVPDIFCNYNIVNKPSRQFAYTVMSYLNAPVVRWDEYYKTYNDHISSNLQFVFNNDSLYAAYGLTLLSILFFMIFNLKRKQRAIPVIIPPSNSTIDFVNVIGSVYYNSKNHKIIAEEKIAAFLEYIRSKFQVNTRLFDDTLLNRVTALSGMNREEVQGIFTLIDKIQFSASIDEQTLIQLNTEIEEFHEKNKR